MDTEDVRQLIMSNKPLSDDAGRTNFSQPWETPVWQHLKKISINCDNQASICSSVFTLFNHINSLLLVNMSAICFKTKHCAGRGALHCFMILRCETPPNTPTSVPLPPPSSSLQPTHAWRFPTRCVHLRSQDSSYGGRLLSSGLLAASSLRCNRNNPIKWWIAFHTDYWASVTPAGGGRDKVATAGTHTCAHASARTSRLSSTRMHI